MKKFLYMNLLVASFGGCGGSALTPDEAQVAAQSAALSVPDALSGEAQRAKKAYSFVKIAAFGELAPSGEQLSAYFFPHGINDQGDVFFESNTASGSSLFRKQTGHALEQMGSPGKPAPGGGLYGESIPGFGNALNQHGDAVFKYLVDATAADSVPVGRHQGVFRVDAADNPIPLVRPGVTLAPSGKPFLGSFMYAGMNSSRDVVFGGIIETTMGIKAPPEPDEGLGMGVFRADAHGNISSIVSPGDPAPGKGVFDFAQNATINDQGDVAFGAHVAGETCNTFGQKQADHIFCAESVYLYRKRTGRIVSIAHQGEAAPGGGKYNLAFGGALNSQGDVAFIGDLTLPPASLEKTGIFLWSRGSTVAVARPGDTMPGGGHMVTAAIYVQSYSLNDRGEVFFFAKLDTDKDGDGADDDGLFVWKDGTIRVIVRSGTALPGMGTASLISAGYGYGSAVSNNHGEVLSYVTTTAGNGYLIKSIPQ